MSYDFSWKVQEIPPPHFENSANPIEVSKGFRLEPIIIGEINAGDGEHIITLQTTLYQSILPIKKEIILRLRFTFLLNKEKATPYNKEDVVYIYKTLLQYIYKETEEYFQFVKKR